MTTDLSIDLFSSALSLNDISTVSIARGIHNSPSSDVELSWRTSWLLAVLYGASPLLDLGVP
jgi:hypothetical protein